MSPLYAAICAAISYTLWVEWYYLKNNYVTLRSKVKVPWSSLRYTTHRLKVMHQHTKYNWPIWRDKKVMARTSFAEKNQNKRKRRKWKRTPIIDMARVCARLCNLQKGCVRLAAASDKVYQLLAHGRWFSQGTPASSTTKLVAMI